MEVMERAQCRDGLWEMGMVSKEKEGRDERVRGKQIKKQERIKS